jgi:hypothetical protein
MRREFEVALRIPLGVVIPRRVLSHRYQGSQRNFEGFVLGSFTLLAPTRSAARFLLGIGIFV